MEIHPGEGVVKEEKFPHSRKPSHRSVCGELWNLRGQHNQQRKEKRKNIEYTPKYNYYRRSDTDACSEWGWAGRHKLYLWSLGLRLGLDALRTI